MKYIIILADQVTQEPIKIICESEDDALDILHNVKPAHHITAECSAAGNIMTSTEYRNMVREERLR